MIKMNEEFKNCVIFRGVLFIFCDNIVRDIFLSHWDSKTLLYTFCSANTQ